MIKKILPYILLLPIYVGVALMFWWLIDTVSIPSEVLKVTAYAPTTVAPGDELVVTYDIEWFKTCRIHIERYMVNTSNPDNGIYILPSSDVIRTKGSVKNLKIPYIIPRHIPEGDYDLIIKPTSACNPFEFFFPDEIDVPIIHIKVQGKPINLVNFDVITPVIKSGDPLIVESQFERKRICRTTIQRSVYNLDGTLIIRMERPGNTRGLGPGKTRESINFPIKLPPGKYYIQSANLAECVDKYYRTVYDQHPLFEVVE